jgi:hypothetical protein
LTELNHELPEGFKSVFRPSRVILHQEFARSEGSAMRLCISMTAAIVAGAGLLSACTTNTAQEDARREYERSVADYENCVAANQMSTCEKERRIMRANKRALSAATQGSRR